MPGRAPNPRRWKSAFKVTLILAVTLAMAISPLAATAIVSDDLNTSDHDDEDTASNPVINVTVTKSDHPMIEGTSAEAVAGYEDDAGDWVPGSDTPFEVNTTDDVDTGQNVNPYSFIPAHIEDDSWGEMPEKDGFTVLNASRWVVRSGAANVTVSNTTTASGVDAVRFDSGTSQDSPGGSGFNAFEVTYENISISSDESKRVLMLAFDYDTGESGGVTEVRVEDESGDYKKVELNVSKPTSAQDDNASIAVGETGDVFYQVKLNALPTVGSGSFDNIEKIRIVHRVKTDTGANVDVSFSNIDIRHKGRQALGEYYVAASDGDYDAVNTTYNATDRVPLNDLSTLDAEYDNAVLKDLEYPARYEAGGLDDEGEDGNWVYYTQEPENPSFDHKENVTYRLGLPSVIDLSYSNAEVQMVQKWPESRYLKLTMTEGASDSKNLSQIGNSGSSQLSNLGSKGDRIILDDTSVNAGKDYVLTYEIETTEDEHTDMWLAQAGGGGGAPADGGTGGSGIAGFLGGIWNWLTTTLPGMVVGLVGGGFVGWKLLNRGK